MKNRPLLQIGESIVLHKEHGPLGTIFRLVEDPGNCHVASMVPKPLYQFSH